MQELSGNHSLAQDPLALQEGQQAGRPDDGAERRQNWACVFGVQNDVPVVGGNAAQKRDYDKRVGVGVMTKSGAKCPLCLGIMDWGDLRIEGQGQRFGSILLAVVVDGADGKEYRLPDRSEAQGLAECEDRLQELLPSIPFGFPTENTPEPFGPRRHGASLRRYGMFTWASMFSPRQLLVLGTFVKWTRATKDTMLAEGYPVEWTEAVAPYLGIAVDRLADYSSSICSWHNSGEKLRNTFGRFAFPIVWDFAEVSAVSHTSGGYIGAVEWMSLFVSHVLESSRSSPPPTVTNQSSIRKSEKKFDVIMTDPPYYDAISYCDLMDFFHVWLRRTMHGHSPAIDTAFRSKGATECARSANICRWNRGGARGIQVARGGGPGNGSASGLG